MTGRIEPVLCDITSAEGRKTILLACPDPDMLINHAPGPPAGNFRNWESADWERAINANMLSAIEMIRAVYDGMLARGFGRIVNITSQSVRAPMPELELSNAARAGLTGFVAGVSREKRDANVTINNLLPGMFVTKPLANYITTRAAAENVSEKSVRDRLLGANPLNRLGRPEEFGASCAFICSSLAGYINGQNILIDGGNFQGVV